MASSRTTKILLFGCAIFLGLAVALRLVMATLGVDVHFHWPK